MRLSICIPTFNRARRLASCLASIEYNFNRSDISFEVCISDNASSDATQAVIKDFASRLPICHHRNKENIGIARNFLQVVGMARGEFAWILGDDDLLMPQGLEKIDIILQCNPDIDLFYINANHLHTEYVDRFPHPFDIRNLPDRMDPFSSRRESGALPYLDLVDPQVSFDFLGGMFLSVFRRQMWLDHQWVLDSEAIRDPKIFSHFDNTFPHVKIFAHAFAKSQAYFEAEPLSVCLTGAREWAPMYPLVHSVRLVEALEQYRANGLPLRRYLRCRNFALNNFIPELAWMFLNKEKSGWHYISPGRLLMRNAIYPNVYLSPFRYLGRRIHALSRLFHRRA